MGSFCPRTSVFSPSIADMPVCTKKSGFSRAAGFMGSPLMSRYSSGIIGGRPSIGSPKPFRTLPKSSFETPILAVSPVGSTLEASESMPGVPCNTCTMAVAPMSWSICPVRFSPSASSTTHISPRLPPESFSTKMSGPDMELMVRYSRFMRSIVNFGPPTEIESILLFFQHGELVFYVAHHLFCLFRETLVRELLHARYPAPYRVFQNGLDVHAPFPCGLCAFHEGEYGLQYPVLLLVGVERVHLAEGALLQESLGREVRDFEREPVSFLQRLHADYLYYVAKLGLPREERVEPPAKLHHVLRDL